MRLPDHEISELVRQHEGWVSSVGKSGQKLECEGADFSGFLFAGRNLSQIVLSGCCLDEADFSDADLYGAQLWGSSAQRANFTRSKLVKAELDQLSAVGVTFDHADLFRCSLYKADLARSSFVGANMQRVWFEQTNLKDAVFERTGIDLNIKSVGSLEGASGTVILNADEPTRAELVQLFGSLQADLTVIE
jgi:uncharacterized protein YjbI with pentapeptide repeats